MSDRDEPIVGRLIAALEALPGPDAGELWRRFEARRARERRRQRVRTVGLGALLAAGLAAAGAAYYEAVVADRPPNPSDTAQWPAGGPPAAAEAAGAGVPEGEPAASRPDRRFVPTN